MNEDVELRRTVRAFVAWARDYPIDGQSAEWEASYELWPEITTAFAAYLDSIAPDLWDEETVGLLLFILARDNECEVLKHELMARPNHLFALANAGVGSAERDARWQLADALGDTKLDSSNCETLLEQFANDDDEYVRRRALIALGRRHSPQAEAHALSAWATGEEYQRIAALEVLATIKSPLLSQHLTLADEDGRQYLATFAKKLRKL